MPRPPSASRLGFQVARRVLRAFVAHREIFLLITGRSRRSFEQRDWVRLRDDSADRLTLYDRHTQQIRESLEHDLGERMADRVVWLGAKAVYSGLLDERPDWDLAETFFNSVCRRALGTVGVDPLSEFVDTDFEDPPAPAGEDAWTSIPWTGDSLGLARTLMEQSFSVPWVDAEADARLVAERIEELLDARQATPRSTAVLMEPFFRGKAAYIVARMATDRGPIAAVLALRNGPRGLFVDAVVSDEPDISILFSFTRSYFHVATRRPWDVVAFLQTLMPRKGRGELYISLGHPRQGKTELYRDIKARMDYGESDFERAPGTPGLVMACFGLPDHDLVFKLIRDEFPAEKATSAREIRERYDWVHLHDRAGRLVDAQEFEHMRLPRARFEASMLRELLDGCGRTARSDGDFVVLERVWVERRLMPLNLVVHREAEAVVEASLDEYAAALRDLAMCNIFAGDLLLKNFGVTRHGRVAFYDYDELLPLTDCVFRDIPEARTPEEEMSATPWYSVGPNDVFPEEFPRFLGLRGDRRKRFLAKNGDLFTAAWWQETQRRVGEGKVVEFVPYRAGLRLREPVSS